MGRLVHLFVYLRTVISLLLVAALGTAPWAAPGGSWTQPASPQAQNPDPVAHLRELEKTLVLGVQERRPWLRLLAGFPERPLGLGRFGPLATSWWADLLEESHRAFVEIPEEQLPPARRAQLEAWSGWTRAEWLLSLSHAPDRWDPLAYLDRIETEIFLLVSLGGEDELSQRHIQRLLQEIPEFLKQAQRGLVAPIRIYSEKAAVRSMALADHINVELPITLRVADWEPELQALFDASRRQAVRALRNFSGWVRERSLAAASPMRILGPQSWPEAVQSLTGSTLSADDLRFQALRKLAELERNIGERKQIDAGDSEPWDPALVATRMRVESRNFNRKLEEAGLLKSLPEGLTDLEPQFVSSLSEPDGLAQLFLTKEGEGNLLLELEGLTMPREIAQERRALLRPAFQEALALRYGLAGAMRLESTARAGFPGDRFLRNQASLIGAQLYLLDAVQRADWIEDAPAENEELAAELVRMQLIEGARFLCALELHTEKAELDPSVGIFARRSGLGLASSRVEVLSAMRDPLYGIGFVGYLELLALEKERVPHVGAQSALLQTLRLAFDQPGLRPRDLRWLLPEEDSPIDESGQ